MARQRMESMLEHIRERDMYHPGVPLPAPGHKQPVFAPGGFATLISLVVVFALVVALRVSGWLDAIGAALYPVTKGLADLTRAVFGL